MMFAMCAVPQRQSCVMVASPRMARAVIDRSAIAARSALAT